MQVLLLSASLGTPMLLEADGKDEAEAVGAVMELFAEADAGPADPSSDATPHSFR